MKTSILILILATFPFPLIAQEEPDYSNDGKPANQYDDNHLKQGLWIYFYDSVQTQISSKGFYVDNKKEGVWTEYHRNGNKRSLLTYKDNRIDGLVKIFYENGNLSEEGLWHTNRWVGEYRFYKSSGVLAYEWYFDEKGRRTGEQKYYYDSGKLMMLGTWDNGRESGRLTEYYENGKVKLESDWVDGKSDGVMREYTSTGRLKAEYVFHDGLYDAASSRIYYDNNPPKNNTKVTEPVTNPKEDVVAKVEEKSDYNNDSPAYERFTGSGYHKLYNSQRLLVREGTFVNGLLVNGKRYYYNSKGQIMKIAIYENGQVVKVMEQ